MNNVIDTGERARALLEKGRTQGCGARDGDGNETLAESEDAVGWRVFAICLPDADVVEWNDMPRRAQAEVLDLFDRAIAVLKGKCT